MELTFASYQLCWLADYVHGPLDLGSVLHEQLLTFVFWTRWSYADIVWSVVQTNHARVKTILTRFVPLRKDGCCCCYEIARVSSLVTAGRPWISTLWFGLNFLDLHCLHDIYLGIITAANERWFHMLPTCLGVLPLICSPLIAMFHSVIHLVWDQTKDFERCNEWDFFYFHKLHIK